MSGDDAFLSRWSRRKTEAKAGRTPEEPAVAAVSAPAIPPGPAPPPDPAAPLPPVESLTPESDFRPFMRSEVDPSLRQKALKTLFRDERFNIMDGLDVYIDDYSKPDPLPESWLGLMNQMTHLGDAAARLEEQARKALESAEQAPPAEPASAEPPEALANAEKPYKEQGLGAGNSVPESGTPDAMVPIDPVRE